MTSEFSGLRRRFVVGALAAGLAGCGQRKSDSPTPAAVPKGGVTTIEGAVAGAWRSQLDRQRDPWRHPVESLRFWGLSPGQTVVEFWPGTGWYTEILAPFLADTGGKLYAATLAADPADPAAVEIGEAYRRRLAGNARLYGRVELTSFGPASGPVAPAGSADLVLFLRNVHNWMAAGIVEKAFRDALAALKPGGVLGVEEHRGEPGRVQDALAADGYVQEAYVIQLAREAGFVLAGSGEINANPKDTKDHPFGVWTLPPTRLSAPRGEAPRPGFDHAKFDAIGESDRMTLKFVKPR
ncbi:MULTISPECIES: class I SAM-dependent methyltransferase [unclassified Caulobacter]|uniref:class I SAM-dependent methyltransferase n=1 Tax=unclassified Caulobacter TaxID=2648921 RepID=UPI000D33246D|nr:MULTISPECIES: class I SAM-dependent methyltransferase [unclassified Caulobacter]PTS87187.1 methyltransferase [Caulobacter sp. HMWF009]PTT05153.1 methyltransferase [Caulobacter sp. HMWF025]